MGVDKDFMDDGLAPIEAKSPQRNAVYRGLTADSGTVFWLYCMVEIQGIFRLFTIIEMKKINIDKAIFLIGVIATNTNSIATIKSPSQLISVAKDGVSFTI